jgi:hypothetical protein
MTGHTFAAILLIAAGFGVAVLAFWAAYNDRNRPPSPKGQSLAEAAGYE